MNLYAYVDNSPLNAMDPSGLFGEKSECDHYQTKCKAAGSCGPPETRDYYCKGFQCCRDFPGHDYQSMREEMSDIHGQSRLQSSSDAFRLLHRL